MIARPARGRPERRTPKARITSALAPRIIHGIRMTLPAVALVGSSMYGSVVAAAQPPLRQLSGRAGCVSHSGFGGACGRAPGLRAPGALAISPDGRDLYAGSGFGGLVVLRRDARSGALRQTQCFS